MSSRKLLIAALCAVLCVAAFLLIPGPAPEQPQQPQQPDIADTVTPIPPEAMSEADLLALFAKIYASGAVGDDALFNLQAVLELQGKDYPADYKERYLSWYATQPPLDPPDTDTSAAGDSDADVPPAESEPPLQANGPADTTHDLGGEKPNWDAWGGDPGTMESEPIYSEGVGDLDQTGLIIH